MNLNQISPAGNHSGNIRLRLYQWLPITLVITLATVLCFYRINAEGLWIDELTSVEDAQGSFAQLRKNLVRPLYYILLRIWMYLGHNDAWLRSLSVVFAIAAVFLVYRLGLRLLGRAEGLVAATLMTLSPLLINHAQEVRMYMVSTCLGVAGTLCLAYALTGEKTKDPSHASLAGWCVFRVLVWLSVVGNFDRAAQHYAVTTRRPDLFLAVSPTAVGVNPFWWLASTAPLTMVALRFISDASVLDGVYLCIASSWTQPSTVSQWCAHPQVLDSLAFLSSGQCDRS